MCAHEVQVLRTCAHNTYVHTMKCLDRKTRALQNIPVHVYTIVFIQTHTIKGTIYPSTGIKNSAIVGSIFLKSFCVCEYEYNTNSMLHAFSMVHVLYSHINTYAHIYSIYHM